MTSRRYPDGALRSLSDADLFAAAQAERRVAIENVADFIAIVANANQRGTRHYGLVLVAPAKYQRGNRRTVGRMIRRLDTLLTEHPLDEATGVRHRL
jgi:hypothetical protein